MRFHHCRSIEHSRFGIVEPARLTEVLEPADCRADGGCIEDEWHDALDYEPSYAWVADHVGFWPLFLAVGDTHDALLTTTYQFQFVRNRARPAPRINALFSWSDPPGALTYMDYME
ncbi:MAG TPA: hypothetical protein VG371_02325 [Solirubrobacteraceae bacterium]|jgi:hypothetical protein|nr:hypothetical protein [Solirubrobacteraceae bacterium]